MTSDPYWCRDVAVEREAELCCGSACLEEVMSLGVSRPRDESTTVAYESYVGILVPRKEGMKAESGISFGISLVLGSDCLQGK